MLYQNVALMIPGRPAVRVAVIGAGVFGSGVVGHSRYVPAMHLCAVADTDLGAARRAYHDAGLPADQVVCCQSPGEALAALEAGKRIVTADAAILFDLPLDVVVEATGIPEAGARHALAAITHGKHVAMVNKETDATVGPLLKHMADRAGVVYSAVDGDQHGLLIGLVSWARLIGLEVLCGGKALDDELIVESTPPGIVRYSSRLPIGEREMAAFAPTTEGIDRDRLAARTAALGAIAGAKPWDLVELTIAANATGLSLDAPRTHCPPLWTGEIPAALCPADLGGILQGDGIIDAAHVLRGRHEASMGGGVFVVVRNRGEALRKQIGPDWITCHPRSETALLVRPHHLLGIEAIGTILSIAVAHTPTAALDYKPRFDVVYRASQRLKAGDEVGHDHSPELKAEILPAVRLTPASPLPAEMARGNRLVRDVEAGELITGADVVRPANSTLWALREQQEALFAKG